MLDPSVTVNAATSRFGANTRIRWTRNLMHHLLKETAVTFNDLVEMRFDDYASTLSNTNGQSIVVTITTGGSFVMEVSKQTTYNVDPYTGISLS